LILAGDITYLNNLNNKVEKEFFNYVSDNFEKVYWLPGNHEFYGGTDSKILSKPFCESLKSNIFLINNQTVTHNNLRIVFSTLWTKIDQQYREIVVKSLNDFYKIKHNEQTLTLDMFEQFHKESLDFILDELSVEKNTDYKTLVATHHVPSYLCSVEEFADSKINSAFVVELKQLIENYAIDAWIFGHSHRNVPEIKIGNTKMLTNQLGYVLYGEYKGYLSNAILEV